VFKTIVVGVDGSAGGRPAFDLACALAAEQSARIVVAHVTELVGGKGTVYPLAHDADEIRATLESQVKRLRADGVDIVLQVRSVWLSGPTHAIAEIADSAGADLIVVGTRGHKPVSEVGAGGLAVRLIQSVHRPLLVVPAADPI
jgi:nucleotide-binding universal stress UspA family protein